MKGARRRGLGSRRWGSPEPILGMGGSDEGLGLWLDLLCAVKHRPKADESEVTGLPSVPSLPPELLKNGDMKRVLVGVL